MTTSSHGSPPAGYPGIQHRRPIPRLMMWIIAVVIAAVIPPAVDLSGLFDRDSSLTIFAAFFLASFGALFLLSRLLHTTPPDAIKLPLWVSQIVITSLALVIWLIRWHTGYALSQPHQSGRAWSWFVFCALQIGSVLLAIRVLQQAGVSPWWAFLPLPVMVYDALSCFPVSDWVWPALVMDLILLAIMSLSGGRKGWAALCLSLAAGVFPPALLLLPLILAPLPASPYPISTARGWKLGIAAIVPMIVIWAATGVAPIRGFTPWGWAGQFEPSAIMNLGLPWMAVYPVLALAIWLFVVRSVLRSTFDPLRAARGIIIFFLLFGALHPLAGPWCLLPVLSLSAVVWVPAAWVLILLVLPVAAIDIHVLHLHDTGWRASINIPCFAVIFALVLREVVRLGPEQRQSGGS